MSSEIDWNRVFLTCEASWCMRTYKAFTSDRRTFANGPWPAGQPYVPSEVYEASKTYKLPEGTDVVINRSGYHACTGPLQLCTVMQDLKMDPDEWPAIAEVSLRDPMRYGMTLASNEMIIFEWCDDAIPVLLRFAAQQIETYAKSWLHPSTLQYYSLLAAAEYLYRWADRECRYSEFKRQVEDIDGHPPFLTTLRTVHDPLRLVHQIVTERIQLIVDHNASRSRVPPEYTLNEALDPEMAGVYRALPPKVEAEQIAIALYTGACDKVCWEFSHRKK